MRKPMSESMRRGINVLLATVTALAVVFITAGVTLGGMVAPVPAPTSVPAPPVHIGAGQLTLVCPDAPRLATDAVGGDIDYDEEFGTQAEQSATSLQAVVTGDDDAAPAAVQFAPVGQEAEEVPVTGGLASVINLQDLPEASVLTAEPAQQTTPLGAATALSRTDAGDLRSLTAAACQPPSSAQWLVGGATVPGSSARLVVTNPGQTPVSATVAAWGETGPVESGAEVLLAPGESRSVLLETLSALERVAVRVTTEGGQVAAAIQDSALSGVVPAGTDMITPTADPALETTIGPVDISEEEAQEDAPVLRLVNPAPREATVSVEVLSAQGRQGLAGAEDLVLEPETVTDVSLSGIGEGPATVRVTSDEAVTGAIQRTLVGQAGDLDPGQPVADRSWLAAQEPVQRGVLALPGEVVDDVAVALSNTDSVAQQVEVTPVAADGERSAPVTVDLEPGTSQLLRELLEEQVSLDEAIALEIAGTGVLATAMLQAESEDGPLLAMIAITPDAQAAAEVPVRLGAW